jgi:hypothetical protein
MKCFYELISSVKCIMGSGFIDIEKNKLGIEKLISYFGKVDYLVYYLKTIQLKKVHAITLKNKDGN